MPVPDAVADLVAFWSALDARLERVEPTWWGAVVTDRRAPGVWDANYARVETADRSLSFADVSTALLPALEVTGAAAIHVVLFRPEETTSLLTDLSTRGHRLSWDVVMTHGGKGSRPAARARPEGVEEVPPGDELWSRVGTSLRSFGVDDPAVIAQLLVLEREAMGAGDVKRWFGVRDAHGQLVALGALVVLAGIGYLDNIVTVPHARGRGHASAIVVRLVAEARAAGARRIVLLVDPDGPRQLYERLGFVEMTRLASTLAPRQSSSGGGT